MSWSPSWISLDSPGSQMTTSHPSPPNRSMRSPHGTSGLFDTGFAGSAKLGARPARSLEPEPFTSLDTIDTADLLEAFPYINADIASLPDSGFGGLLQGGNCSSDNLNLLTSIKSEQDALMTSSAPFVHSEAASGFHDDDAFLGNTPDFLEQFTDLSSYSNDNTLMNNAPVAFDPDQFMKEMAEIEDFIPATPTPMMTDDDANALAGGVKRSASEALLSEAEEEDDAVFVNPDHSDYTRKAPALTASRVGKGKRRRVASSADSVVSSTSSFSVVPSASTSSAVGDDKYCERRRKNNIASRRSRETRKQKFVQMDQQADELEAKNEALRVKVAELERITKLMKDALVKQLAGAGKAAAASVQPETI